MTRGYGAPGAGLGSGSGGTGPGGPDGVPGAGGLGRDGGAASPLALLRSLGPSLVEQVAALQSLNPDQKEALRGIIQTISAGQNSNSNSNSISNSILNGSSDNGTAMITTCSCSCS